MARFMFEINAPALISTALKSRLTYTRHRRVVAARVAALHRGAQPAVTCARQEPPSAVQTSKRRARCRTKYAWRRLHLACAQRHKVRSTIRRFAVGGAAREWQHVSCVCDLMLP